MLFTFLCLLIAIGKLNYKPLFKIIKHMWFLMLILFIIGFLKDRDNGANLILLALNIIFIVVFYIPFF